MKLAKTCLGIVWLGCTALGFAQPGPEWGQTHLPPSTEFYLEVQPRVALNPGPSLGERLRRSPLFRVISQALQVPPGELVEFPYFDGRFLLAVARKGEFSPLEAYYRAEKKHSQVRDLRCAAELAFEGVNLYRKNQKRFPKSVQDLVSHEYFEAESIPAGSRLELRRDGKRMAVIGISESGEEVRWPDPDFKSGYSLADVGGLLIAVGCPNSGFLTPQFRRWDAELEELSAEGDHWKFTFDRQDFYFYMHKDWVYFTNQPELVAPFLAATPPLENLRSNLRFAQQRSRLQAADTEMSSFLDIQDILRTSPGLCESAGWSADKILLRSLAVTSGSHLDAAGQLQVETRGFLQWDGVKNVTLGPPAADTLASKVPAGVETVYWADLPGWIRIIDRLAGEFPGVNDGFSSIWAELEKRLGFSLARESLAAGAQLYVYGEAVDSYASQLEMVINLVQNHLGASSSNLEESLAFTPSKVPLLAVLEVASPDIAGKIQSRLKERLGAQPSQRKVENVGYTLSQDGRCAWTVSNTTQFWANGYTERLLPRVFSVYQGTAPNLASLPSCQLFQQDRQGELLFYLHTKADRECSLLKGLLLYLGSDFRPEADLLGRLRDFYAAIEVVPEGISLRATLYSQGVVAPAPKPVVGEEE